MTRRAVAGACALVLALGDCGWISTKGLAGNTTENSVPFPGSLVTRISPPISWQSRWLIARPRPLPPYLRVDASST